ncbi:MAG: helix-turn-helix domain-containing protein [Oscillospiraceae bacterium]
MENCTEYMENNLNCISTDEYHLPAVSDCDILTASDSFFHMNRTADFNVLIYVTDGVMYVTEGGADHEIRPGELLFLKSGINHYGKYETPRGTRWLYAHFLLPENISETGLIIPKKTQGLLNSDIEKKLIRLCDIFHSDAPQKGFRANLLLGEILVDMVEYERSPLESTADKLCSFLELNTDKDFSKALITERFFLSYSHLAAGFKREKGMSMGQFHNEARMKRACSLLRSTLMSVGEIADMLGFSDMLYFSRKFHAFSGVSPTEYRRQVQKKY